MNLVVDFSSLELLKEYLPILIPLLLVELGLTIAALVHILTHDKYKVGTRLIWVILAFVQIIGPVLYFIIGRSDESNKDDLE